MPKADGLLGMALRTCNVAPSEGDALLATP